VEAEETVGQMVEEAKTRIENLSVEQVEADRPRRRAGRGHPRRPRAAEDGFIPTSTHRAARMPSSA
jgi:hypothetical protein